jgi:hypothetical protein
MGAAIEQLTPLTDQEREILSQKKSSALKWMSLMAILSVSLLALLFVLHTLYFLIALPIFSLVAAVKGVVSLVSFRALSRDLRDGQKKVISGPVEAQNIDVSRETDSDGIEGAASYNFGSRSGARRLLSAKSNITRSRRVISPKRSLRQIRERSSVLTKSI